MLSQNGHSFTPPSQKAVSAKFLSCRRRRQRRHAGSLREFFLISVSQNRLVDDIGCSASAASSLVCLRSPDSHLGHPQCKKLLERVEHGVPGTIIVGQVQFYSQPWPQRGHENHGALLLPPYRQIHRTGLDRPIDDQDRSSLTIALGTPAVENASKRISR